MEYDSDSELHATDTLRCDSDSEEDNHTNQDVELPKNKSDEESISKNAETEMEPDLDVPNETSDDEDHIGERSTVRRSKFSNIVDSESEGDEVPPERESKPNAANTDTVDLKNRLQSLLDSDSSEQEAVKTETKTHVQTKRRPKKSANKLDILSGSDSDGEHKEKSRPSLKEKRKPKKVTKPEETVVRSAKEILASLNLFFDDDDDEDVAVPVTAKPRYSPSARADQSACSSSEDESTEGLMRSKRPIRKMTAKQAMEEKQIIQSESQRMAREKYIDVPYHRTKAFSFEEFRARKTICRPDPSRDCKGNFAAANKSIRMTAEQLEEFARKLEERERESQQFFKSESESAESEPEKEAAAEDEPEERMATTEKGTHDTKEDGGEQVKQTEGSEMATEPTEDQGASGNVPLGTDSAETASDEPMDAIDEIVNRTSDNMEQMIASFSEAETPTVAESERVEINYDLFSNESPSRTVPLTGSKKTSLLASLKLPPCPRLSGNSDMLIDLDSGTLEPKQQSGADILFQRLVKCSGTVQKPATPSAKAISILSTEHGVVKLDSVKLFSNEERPLVHTEPTPGAAYLKLKQVLKEKIDNNRREFIRKREAEFAKKMDLEKADSADDEEEEEIELPEDEEEDQEEMEEEQGAMDEADAAAGQQKNTLLDDEALDEDMSEADESSSSDEDEEDDQETAGGNKTTRRIIKAFEDSDDEALPASGETSKAIVTERPMQLSTFSSEGPTMVSETGTNSEGNEETITLLWKDDDERQDQCEEDDDDLMALCSGQFATQLPTQKQPLLSQVDNCDSASLNVPNQEPLYTQTQEPFRESQLMDLCSGRFETQANDADQAANGHTPNAISTDVAEAEAQPLDDSELCVGGRLRLDSSDDDAERVESKLRSKVKKHKRKKVNISDDEDDSTVEPAKHPVSDEMDDESSDTSERAEPDGDEAEEEGERYVDYDSEENEVEVRLTKKEKELMSAKFVENEAELSESEWGSADEDEKDLDRYDVEMGDEEQYDQRQLQQELEKIHNRQMLDQDDREVEQLKEFFLEDEENDGVGRVRQFRWKNVEKTFSLDYDKDAQPGEDAEGNGGNGSDEETELNWRKMRHERNLLLKEKNIDLSTIDLTATTLLNPADGSTAANASDEKESAQASGKKKITIIRKGTSGSGSSSAPNTVFKEDNPFLISNSTFLQGHKASFLSRDQETLNKLANMIPETEGATSSVLTAKARNFVFATLSPAVEKTSKRSLDVEDAEPNANTKKPKTSVKEIGSRKKLLLDSNK